jgi:formate/nitrite transporter
MAFKKPAEIAQAAVEAGKAKTLLSVDKMFLLGILAGAYIAAGGFLAVIVGGGVNAETLGVGVQKLLFAGVFPVGLMLVVIAGSELFTGNCMLPPIAWFAGEAKTDGVLKNWVAVYLGNLVGSIFVAYCFTHLTGLFTPEPWHGYIIKIAEAKANLGAWKIFWRAVGCNWLVTLAVWMSIAADDVIGKIFAIWFPIMAFVGLGFEHSVANMFFIPAGMFAGANVSVGQFLIGNLLWATIGNIVSGVFMVAWIYYYVYLRGTKK